MKLFILKWRRHILRESVENGIGLIADHQRRLDNRRLEQLEQQRLLRQVDARIDALEHPRTLITQALRRSA